MQAFVDAVAVELERPRVLLKQVVDHLASHYSVSRDELGAFFTSQLDALEDYEVDLLFSPLFTPHAHGAGGVLRIARLSGAASE